MPASGLLRISPLRMPAPRERITVLLVLALLGGILLAGQSSTPGATPRTPGDQVRWTTFPPQKSATNRLWGEFLTDLETHLPARYGTSFRDDDRVIHAHETTHGIHAHLHNQHPGRDGRLVGFYVGDNRAILIQEPHLRLSDVAALIPEKLRKMRYQPYLIEQQKDWEEDPLYLFDEWVAYTNGAQAGVELAQKGLYQPGKNDAVFALLEVNVYAVYAVLAARKKDRDYDSGQLSEFLAWNLRRSMVLYRAGCRLDAYNWDHHTYYDYLRSSRAAAEMRGFLLELFGESWCEEVMGFSRS